MITAWIFNWFLYFRLFGTTSNWGAGASGGSWASSAGWNNQAAPSRTTVMNLWDTPQSNDNNINNSMQSWTTVWSYWDYDNFNNNVCGNSNNFCGKSNITNKTTLDSRKYKTITKATSSTISDKFQPLTATIIATAPQLNTTASLRQHSFRHNS